MQRKSGPQAYTTKDNAYKSPFARYQQLPINNTSNSQNSNRNFPSLTFHKTSSDTSTQSFGDPLISLPGSRNQLGETHSRFRPPSPLLLDSDPVDIFSLHFDLVETDEKNNQPNNLKEKKKTQTKPVKHKIGKALPDSLNTLDGELGRQSDNVREVPSSIPKIMKGAEQDIPKNKIFIPSNPNLNKENNVDLKEGLKRIVLDESVLIVFLYRTKQINIFR